MFRKLLGGLILVIGFAISAKAQVIHGNPQCQQYVDDATTITPGVTCHLPPATVPLSAQCHWSPSDAVVPIGPGMLGHTHIEIFRPPLWAEISGPITLHGQFQLFHMAGAIDPTRIEGGLIKSLIWDATGTSTPPLMVGDPMGVVVFPFTVIFDPALSDGTDQSLDNVPAHGWWTPRISAVTRYTNGATTVEALIFPLYSMQNPSAPETVSRFPLMARCQGNSPTSHPVGYGTPAVEFLNTYPPILAPLTTTESAIVLSYEYGNQSPLLAQGSFNQILDMNLHAIPPVPGTLISQEFSDGGNPNGNNVVFDPAVIGTGAHKMALTWDQKSGNGNADFTPNEEVTALLVLPFTVGTSGSGSGPLNCIVGPWGTVSVSTTDTPAVTSGNIQTRTETTMTLQSRAILQQPSIGGTACPLQ